MKKLLFALLLVAAFVAVSGNPVQAGEDKVEICHYPPGNPENVQVISVGATAVPAHEAHGDVLFSHGVPCPAPEH